MPSYVKFWKGLAEDVPKQGFSDGQFLIAIDSGEVFIDHEQERIGLGIGGGALAAPGLDPLYPQDVDMKFNATSQLQVRIAEDGIPNAYSYQWYLNNSPIEGAITSTYILSGLSIGTYTYYCTVTNEAGTVTSRLATVVVADVKPNFSTFSGNFSIMENSTPNWSYKITSTGTYTPDSDYEVDLWGIGGGGSGANGQGAGGGGGGYSAFQTGVTLKKGVKYTFTIGAGGAALTGDGTGATGGTTRITDANGNTLLTASGGQGGQIMAGGAGGSGGGAGTYEKQKYGGYAGTGGSNGANGGNSYSASGGKGSGQNMYPFRQNGTGGMPSSEMKPYGGGGAGSERQGPQRAGGNYGGGSGEYQIDSNHDEVPPTNGIANSGGGGGGAQGTTGGAGGSGIIMIRNTR